MGSPNRTFLEWVLISSLYLFCFVALVFEPLYYFGCNWDDRNQACDKSPHLPVTSAVRIWRKYVQWDPLFEFVPMWLRIMCTIEVFVFGPLYGICAYGVQFRRTWLPAVALPFAGALFYSTIVYFAMEIIEFLPNTNLFAVFIVNIPWSVVPLLLAYYALPPDCVKVLSKTH
jgi:hypothetical protein